MKILIIRNYPSYMDVEKNTYNIQEVGLAKALVRMGNICDIIFWTDKEEKEVIIPINETMHIKVFYKHGKTALKNTIYTGCNNLFEQYDILQPAEYNQLESWLLAKKYPQKTIIYHGPYYSPFNKRYNLMCSFFDKIFLKRYLKLGTKFIVKSKLAQEFLESKNIQKNNISTIGVGIDIQMLSNGKRNCIEPLYTTMKQDSNLKLLYIGRFEERRNIPFIFDVFKNILRKNIKATLYMIGTGESEYLKNCWSYANKLEIHNYIIYQEKMEQKYLSQIYELADFFILPTQYEIFGMVILEAMYYHTIVLTTNNGGSSTLIENNQNGCIIEKINSKLWADKIQMLLADNQQMNAIKNNAHDTIANLYTWDKLAFKFLDCYKNLNNKKEGEL